LPAQETLLSASTVLAAGIEEALAGRPDAARQAAQEARAIFEAGGNDYGARAAILMLAEVYSTQGGLHQAAHIYRQLIARAGDDPSDMATALLGLAALSYECNELQEAEARLSPPLDLCNHHADAICKYYAAQPLLVPGSL